MSLPLDGLALHQSAGLSQLVGASQGVAHLPSSGKGRNRELPEAVFTLPTRSMVQAF